MFQFTGGSRRAIASAFLVAGAAAALLLNGLPGAGASGVSTATASDGWVAYTLSGNGSASIAVQHDPKVVGECGNFGCSIPINNFSGLVREASWSPDGTHLVFAGRFDGNFDIYTSEENGSHLVQLTATA